MVCHFKSVRKKLRLKISLQFFKLLKVTVKGLDYSDYTDFLILLLCRPKMDDDKDPNDSLMEMMKKMYDEGDDDMKRTIAQAWTQSKDKKGGP